MKRAPRDGELSLEDAQKNYRAYTRHCTSNEWQRLYRESHEWEIIDGIPTLTVGTEASRKMSIEFRRMPSGSIFAKQVGVQEKWITLNSQA